MIFSLLIVVFLIFPVTVNAYVGPGAGISAIGAILALVAAFFLAIVGFVWYPLKRILKRKQAKKEANSETSDQSIEK